MEDVSVPYALGEVDCHILVSVCGQIPVWCTTWSARLAGCEPRHPWTNGQVERTGRTLKDATVKRFHYETHDQLRSHLADFIGAYNFGRRLKTLKGLTPYEAIC